MATVKEALKETLVGTTKEPELTQEIQATFDRHARHDEATGEFYMEKEGFVDAIAPKNEDYVSFSSPSPHQLCTCLQRVKLIAAGNVA